MLESASGAHQAAAIAPATSTSPATNPTHTTRPHTHTHTPLRTPPSRTRTLQHNSPPPHGKQHNSRGLVTPTSDSGLGVRVTGGKFRSEFGTALGPVPTEHAFLLTLRCAAIHARAPHTAPFKFIHHHPNLKHTLATPYLEARVESAPASAWPIALKAELSGDYRGRNFHRSRRRTQTRDSPPQPGAGKVRAARTL